MSRLFDWEFIKGSNGEISLENLGTELTNICDDLYKLGTHEYVITQSNYSISADEEQRLLGLIFYWAPSVGVVLRAAKRDIAQDAGNVVKPPSTLLIDGWRWVYKDILDACESGKLGPYRAIPFGTHGKLIGRLIAVGQFSYFFRSQADPEDKAFAVSVDVRSIRWEKAGRNDATHSR